MPRGYLYLLPELFFGAPGIHRLDPHLRKSIHLQLLGEGIDPLPKKPLCLSQPLPNKGYIVAGTRSNRMGWFLPLEYGVNQCAITLLWQDLSPRFGWAVEHRIRFVLLDDDSFLMPGDGTRVWSMDVMPWNYLDGFYRGEPPVNTQPVSRFWPEKVHPARGIRILEDPRVPKTGRDKARYDEDLVIPPVSLGWFQRRCMARFSRVLITPPPPLQG